MGVAFENIPKEFVTETIFFDYKEPITKVLGKLEPTDVVVIMKDNEYYGIIDDRSIARTGGSIRIEKGESASKYSTKVPVLTPQTTLAKAIYHFYESHAKALPYYESGKITGVVRRDAVLKSILSIHLLSGYKVGDIMSTPVVAIDADATIAEASATMRQRKINRLPVISKGKLEGVVTYHGIMNYAAKLQERPSKVERATSLQNRVMDIVEPNVNSIDMNGSVEDVIRNLVEQKTSSLLVTRKDSPVGMISVRDIFSAAVTTNAEATEGIIISGIDESTRQYEEDIRSELEKLVDKLDKFSKVKVERIALHVRKQKVRNYELSIRLWLEKGGAISASMQGYSIEKALKDLLDEAYATIKNKKEIVYSEKRLAVNEYEEEEREEE